MFETVGGGMLVGNLLTLQPQTELIIKKLNEKQKNLAVQRRELFVSTTLILFLWYTQRII